MYYFRWLSRKILYATFSLLFLSTSTANVIAAEAEQRLIRLATTTSTENSGLLKYLLPKFQNATGYRVHVIAVGTGKALRMGRDGDVDVVLVHAPSSEEAFVEQGYGEKRYRVMYNDFVIVGPKNDPAQLTTAKRADSAMQRIAESKVLFLSRGDDSGTHKKERSLWKNAGVQPGGNWYREAGQGMGKVIQMAGELDAYTLADRGTWLAYKDKSALRITFQRDGRLHNPYSIIAVNPKHHTDTNYTGAMSLIKWITSYEGQKMIGNYRIADTQLFEPSADQSQVSQLSRNINGHTE